MDSVAPSSHAGSTTGPHRLAAITPWVGQFSNVWMHRQFDQLSDHMPLVITWEYLNQDVFPLPNTDVRLVPERFAQPLRGWTRTMNTLVNPRIGCARFGPAFRRWLQQQLIESKTDAILGQFGNFAMVAEEACKGIGVASFAHFHGHDMSAALRKKRYRQSIERHWHNFTGIICVASYQRDYLLSHGYSPDSVALIPCGAPAREIKTKADKIRADAGPRSPERDSECHFFFVGRYVEKKDPMSLLKAFESCFAMQPHARLTMAGFGPLEDDCKQYIATKPTQLQQSVNFIGKLKPAEVVEHMATADVYVQHSRVAPDGDMEGWPVAIAEAMASGLPIIATRHAGIVDQVVEGETGYLCDEGDWQTMGDNMARIAADANLRKHIAHNSQERIMQFDAALLIEQLREFMHERIAINKHAKSRAA